jgi:DHA1 family bicyclomycin/chloramphenicol resistance-like MFS transporter
MSETFKFVSVIGLITLLGSLGTTIYLAAFPELEVIFNVSKTQIKFSLTIYFIGLIIGAVLSGPLSDIFGRQKILALFLLLFSISSLFCALSPSMSPFLIGRFFQGFSSAGPPVIAMALVADRYTGANYHKIISFVFLMLAVGPAVAPILGSSLFAVFGWRIIFYFLVVFGLIALALTYYAKLDLNLPRQAVKKTLQEYLIFIKHPYFKYYVFLIGVLYSAFFVFITISPYIFRLQYEWTMMEFSWVGLALACGGSIGSYLNSFLIDRVGMEKVILIGLAILFLAFLLLFSGAFTFEGIGILVLGSLYMIGTNLISICLSTSAIKAVPGFIGTASSLIKFGQEMSASLVSVLVLFFPETVATINYFFLAFFVIGLGMYFKLRSSF